MVQRRQLLLVLVILASGGVYLLGNGSVALWDRDEPRYAQTSRQMLQTGDWVVPHYLDMVRTAKPAMIYWLQAGAMHFLGDNAFAARLPSSVATIVLLIFLAVFFWRRIGSQRTLWMVFILASSALVIVEAKFCITDAVLLVWVTIAQICLYAIWRGNGSWLVIITMAVAIGLAGLTKGPVILGFQAMTLIVLWVLRWVDGRYPPLPAVEQSATVENRETSALVVTAKVLTAILLVCAIFLPWWLMVQHRAAAAFGGDAVIKHEIWDRILTPLEQHTGPPGYYFLFIWITFFPWSLLLPLAIGLAWTYRAESKTRFALAAVIGPWIMLECIRTKLPHYFLPVFPPLAFLTADALVRCLQGEQDDLKSRGFLRGVGIWAGIVAAVSLAPWILVHVTPQPPIKAMVAISLVGPVYGGAVFIFFMRRRIAAGAVAMGVGMLVLVCIAYGFYLPNADFLRVSPRVAEKLIALGVTQKHQVIMMDYMEPSLAFYQGGTIREAGDIGFTPRFAAQFTPWMVITADKWRGAQQAVRDMFEVVDQVHGLAYADRGRWVDVLIIHRKDAALVQPAMK